MKVAVCISGQMRSFEKCYSNIYENIIKPNNADVFIHTWYDENNLRIEGVDPKRHNIYYEKGDDVKVIDLYKPKSYLIETPIYFRNPNIKIPEKYIERIKTMRQNNIKDESIHHSYSMFYSIFKCNQIKEEYSYKNNIYYDCVIKIRFDIRPTEPLLCLNYDMNYIYYAEINQPDELISDWINMGSTEIMNIYSSTFLHLEYLNNFKYFKKEQRINNTCYPSDECSWGNEHLIRDIMLLFNIQKKILNETYYLF